MPERGENFLLFNNISVIWTIAIIIAWKASLEDPSDDDVQTFELKNNENPVEITYDILM